MHLEEYLLYGCSLATTGIRPNAFYFPATPTFILEHFLYYRLRAVIFMNNKKYLSFINKKLLHFNNIVWYTASSQTPANRRILHVE